jgi:hypothetical protein
MAQWLSHSAIVIASILIYGTAGVPNQNTPNPREIVTDERPVFEDLLDTIFENLLLVIDSTPVTPEIKDEVRAAIGRMFSEKSRQTFAAEADEKDLVEKIHQATHDVIDNLELTSRDVAALHTNVHHVFSATFVGSGCYEEFTSNHTGQSSFLPSLLSFIILNLGIQS